MPSFVLGDKTYSIDIHFPATMKSSAWPIHFSSQVWEARSINTYSQISTSRKKYKLRLAAYSWILTVTSRSTMSLLLFFNYLIMNHAGNDWLLKYHVCDSIPTRACPNVSFGVGQPVVPIDVAYRDSDVRKCGNAVLCRNGTKLYPE